MTGPTIDHFTAEVLRFPLDKPVGGSGVASVDVLAVDLIDTDGALGTGFSYCLSGGSVVVLAAARDLLETRVSGQLSEAPEKLWQNMDASLNRIGRGAHYLAMAAIDVAAWDLRANCLGQPLGIAMGGVARTMPVYGSGGYRPNQTPEQTRDQAQAHVAEGFSAIKLRLAGNCGDLKLLRAARDAVDDTIGIMTDANEKCDLANALELATACADHRCLWLEEPLPASDVGAYRDLARASPVTIATGEHLQGTTEVMPYLDGHCAKVLQPDLAMMGGLTPSLMTARAADTRGVSIAPHFLPALFIHLAAAAPNVTWLEDFPLLEPLFDAAAKTENGAMTLPDVSGHGLAWADGVRGHFRLEL